MGIGRRAAVLRRLADLACSRPRRVAVLGGLLFAVVGVIGGPAPGSFNAPNAFNDPGSQATRAETQIERATGAFPSADVIALVRGSRSSGQVTRVARTLQADPGIATVAVPPASGPSGLVSRNGRYVIVAAVLPLTIGAFSVLGAFAVLRAINAALSLSPFALNLVIGLGLGLAVDYSLFCVSRFREELGRGADVPEAVRITMQTAGRTVLFSATTVVAAMACLTVFPQRFLVSMGLGGLVVALVAATSTVVFLPALFMLMGRRLGKVKPGPQGSGGWYRLARVVMRNPAIVAVSATVALLLVATPALGIRWSGIDASVLPVGKSARTVSDVIARDFPGADSTPALVAVSAPPSAGPALRAYAGVLKRIPGVYDVSAPRDLGRATWEIEVDGRGTPITEQSQSIVRAIRAGPAPYPAVVGGATAARAYLPRRQPHGSARLHQATGDRADQLPRPRRDCVWALDRLWSVPAHPDQGGPRPRSPGRGGGCRRAATNRRDRYRRRDPARGRPGSVRDQPAGVPQGTGCGGGLRGPGRRVRGPRTAGAGADAVARQRELVVAWPTAPPARAPRHKRSSRAVIAVKPYRGRPPWRWERRADAPAPSGHPEGAAATVRRFARSD